MKKVLMAFVLLSVAALSAVAEDPAQEEELQLTTQEEKMSYMLGHSFGDYLRDLPADMSVEMVIAGIKAGYQGEESLISEEDANALRHDFAVKMQEAQEKMQREEAAKNLAEGKAFLDENQEKEGVKVTESGLQYKVLREGDGPSPEAQAMVRAHYEGRFIDGQVFDSSYDRGEPVTFPLDRVIEGWSEGVQMMNVGAKHRLFIPPDLGYGEAGPSPNAVLVFDVELLGIEEAQR